jgi:hypothetical protein
VDTLLKGLDAGVSGHIVQFLTCGYGAELQCVEVLGEFGGQRGGRRLGGVLSAGRGTEMTLAGETTYMEGTMERERWTWWHPWGGRIGRVPRKVRDFVPGD